MHQKLRTTKQQPSSQLIANLTGFSTLELRALWRSQFGCDPFTNRPDLLIVWLAYRLQVQEFGGLSRITRARLADIASDVDAGKQPAFAAVPRIKPGTRLIRGWKGDIHEVTVVDGGFLYRQVTYDSLSEIARLITGTRWSGPRFFGLNRSSAATAGDEQ
ncbi:conserved protein of unknown function [Georgfuchsia toluolica]|uniref:DUF2924 domain-containing protein n=1 Tax=Georgfuchsia toluolica TaxID=424218 RepID=A0A916J712_9PROT|nr:DUF2924 domain-containing protein [Georgfuchsia toluolica]CAG4885112.1 conserved protein of unknown function [Georgfuchsia toluolica]